MSVETASVFLSLLALLALAIAAASVVLTEVAARRPDGAAAEVLVGVRPMALPLAWAIATVATLGSLYYSEIAHFTPCKLCWYQRIAMYPLAVILGLAAIRRDRSVRAYAMPVAGIGLVVALYHSWLQANPDSSSTFCTLEAPCTTRHVWELGFVSIPFMAACGFAAVLALLASGAPDE